MSAFIQRIGSFKLDPLICGLAALIMGISGQLLLAAKQLIPAVVLYILAVLLIILALRKQPGPAALLAENQPLEISRRYWVGRITGALAIVIAGVAFWMFTTAIPPVYPWLLHLASIVLFIFASACVERPTHAPDEKMSAWSRLQIVLLLAIFAFAAFMRLYRFGQIPFGTWYDEANYGLNAIRMLNEPGYLPVFIESTGLPSHFILLIALFFRILGVSTLSIRAVSVVFGLATVGAAFLAGQELFDRRMGFVLAFLLAAARWDINWSRIGMHGVTVPFFELLTIYFILRALRKQRLLDYTLAGVSIGIGLCFYFSFRLFPVVIGLFFLVLWAARHNFLRVSWRGLLLIGLGVLIASVPVTQFALQNPGEFLSRMKETSIFEGKTSQEAWKAIAATTGQHLLMFNYEGDHNGRHNLVGEPMLDTISAALLVLGVGLSIWRIRQPGSFLLLVWLLLMLVPGIFTLDYESPQSLRAIGSLPAAYLLAAVPIDAFWKTWDQAANKHRPLFFTLPLVLLLGGIAYLNFHIYFDRQAKSFDSWSVYSTAETITGKLMAEMGNQVDYYISAFYYQSPTVQFLAPDVTDYYRVEPHQTLPLPMDGKKGAVIIVDADRLPYLLQAKRYYPNATFKIYSSPDGRIGLYGIILKPQDITAAQGLTASYYRGADWTEKPSLVRDETNFNFDWKDGDPLAFSFGVEWQGILFSPTFGLYRLIVHSPAAAELSIDGTQIKLEGSAEQTAELVLAKGTHAFKLRTQAQAGHFELDWQPPGEVQAPIPPYALLLPRITNNGLLGRYYANGDWQGEPAFTQIDSWIHFYFHNPPLPRPYTVEWLGKINITNSGQYQFGLESIDESALFIDGKPVVENPTANHYEEASVFLTEGLHPIRILFADRTASTHINIYWTPPGSENDIIPQEVLFPPQADESSLNPKNWTEVTNPPPAPSPSAPTEVLDLPVINARRLWQTGECGSGKGQFQKPHGITADQAGNIWIADTGNRRVVELDPQGQFVQSFGLSGSGEGQFLQPFDLVIGKDGNLVVLDSESPFVLQRFTPQGEFQAVLGADLGTYSARGLGIDSAGDLYIVDTGVGRLIKISPAGDLLHQWGKDQSGQDLGQPVGTAIDQQGNIYIIEAVKGLVWKFSSDGKSTSWSAVMPSDTLDGPHITIGENQLLFITDPEKKRVVVLTPDGQKVGQLRASTNYPDLFMRPVGVAVQPGGVLIVSDSTLCRVQAFLLPELSIK